MESINLKKNSFYPLAHDNWDLQEKNALLKVIESNSFTMGENVRAFENKLEKFHNVKNAIMTNSGSSANLLIIGSLIEKGLLKKYDEVIVPAVSWSTTFFPLHQYGLKIIFVDTDLFGNINPIQIKKAITKKTKAIFAVNLLGFPAELIEIKKISDENNIILIEDNCESFGASHNGKYCGTWGLMGSLSFFYSHHLCTMEGGCILTNNDILADYCRSLRAHGWTRDLRNLKNLKDTDEFKEKFRFILPGYCLRPSELNAAVGLVQLSKWPDQKKKRLRNAKYFTDIISKKNVIIPKYQENSTWFGFPVICKDKKSRVKLIKECTSRGIECRPIVAGNFTKQPVIKRLNHSIRGDLLNAGRIDECGIFFGNDSRDLKKQIKNLSEIL